MAIIKKIFLKLIRSLTISNAQAGEDRVILFLFGSLGLRRISYIDIGANHPIENNNTYLFYTKKSRGVLIEPDPFFSRRLKKARPKDIIVQAGITDTKSGESDFYIFDEPALNTLSKEEAELRRQSGKFILKETIKIKLLTIEDIITQHLDNTLPHLISLDVEGVDYAVLNAFDFARYPVPVWIVETCEYSETYIKPKVHSIIDLMKSKGYFVYADTYINTIFVNNDWFDNFET